MSFFTLLQNKLKKIKIKLIREVKRWHDLIHTIHHWKKSYVA